MWQVLLAAAAAGSGILAKKLIYPNNNAASSEPSSGSKNDQNLDQPETPLEEQDSIFISNGNLLGNMSEEGESETPNHGSIFRFSSSCCGSDMGSKNHLRKKLGSGSRGSKGNFEKNGSWKGKKKCGFVGGGGGQEGLGVDQRKIANGKRFIVYLKKRRTSKCVAGKCESCASKESSLFAWGLGVGIMYMMSNGTSEICRLNTAMDETSKVIHELKAELSKRKTLLNTQSLNPEPVFGSITKYSRERIFDHIVFEDNVIQRDSFQSFNYSAKEEDECMSDGFPEDLHPEVLDMDQLEAEFVSELQKLPWSAAEGSGSDGRTDICENDMSGFSDFNPSSNQYGGVSPSVLDEKLSQLLIEQQENQIVHLESELQLTNSKLHDKEVELQALKDCVRRLTEFSLAGVSDEENEGEPDNCRMIDDDQDEVPSELKKSLIGMKRGMQFG